jgi:hypothetical protein
MEVDFGVIVQLDESGLPCITPVGCDMQDGVTFLRRVVKALDDTRGMSKH